jgi:aminopeptidase-like protein
MGEIGEKMYKWASDLFPINRSLTGPGVRETLLYIKKIIKDLEIKSVPTGYKAFDWEVPEEWSVDEAYIETKDGKRIVDFKKNNLHLVGYSIPVDSWVTLNELDEHLYSLPEQPDAVPYVTSYYKKHWGLCLPHKQRMALKDNKYHVVIRSELKSGVLNYAEFHLPGLSDKEVFLSTYICHPSMANNELSGPVVTTALAQWLISLKERYYTYRIIFIPETIGSIVYLSKNLDYLKRHVIAGFNITCMGDDRCYSFLPSRNGNTFSDKVALHVLKFTDQGFKRYSWLDRGSDERQYCAPGVDLPIASIMRSKFGTYPEYHTSIDDLDLITPKGLEGGYYALKYAIEIIEKNVKLRATVLCEPQLSKRGLYPSLSLKGSNAPFRTLMNLISLCDGTKTLLEISEILDKPFWDLFPIAQQLIEYKLLEVEQIGSNKK